MIILTVTEHEYNTILSALAKLPYEDVGYIIQDLMEQGEARA